MPTTPGFDLSRLFGGGNGGRPPRQASGGGAPAAALALHDGAWWLRPQELAALRGALASDEARQAAVSFWDDDDDDEDDGPPIYEYRTNAQGVAEFSIRGTMTRAETWLTRWYGGTSTEKMVNTLAHALANPVVRGASVKFDTPGGEAQGTAELCEALAEFGDAKPISGFVAGCCCSAGYFAAMGIKRAGGSLTGTLSNETGSIGTYAVLRDFSKMYQEMGITTKVVRARGSKYKGVGVMGAPITDEEEEHVERYVNALNDLFVTAVEEGLGVPHAQARRLADGDVYIGRAAAEAGLIDGVETYQQSLDRLAGVVGAGGGRSAFSLFIPGRWRPGGLVHASVNANNALLLPPGVSARKPTAAPAPPVAAPTPTRGSNMLFGRNNRNGAGGASPEAAVLVLAQAMGVDPEQLTQTLGALAALNQAQGAAAGAPQFNAGGNQMPWPAVAPAMAAQILGNVTGGAGVTNPFEAACKRAGIETVEAIPALAQQAKDGAAWRESLVGEYVKQYNRANSKAGEDGKYTPAITPEKAKQRTAGWTTDDLREETATLKAKADASLEPGEVVEDEDAPGQVEAAEQSRRRAGTAGGGATTRQSAHDQPANRIKVRTPDDDDKAKAAREVDDLLAQSPLGKRALDAKAGRN